MRPPSRPFAIALALSLASVVGTAAARGGVYKWIDDRGNIHYDDQSLLAERITRSSLADRTVAPEPAIKVPDDFADEVKERCTDFSERAASYNKAGEVYGRDPFGNTYRLSSRQIALAKHDADVLKTRFCRPDAPRLILMEERAAYRATLLARAEKTQPKGKTGKQRP